MTITNWKNKIKFPKKQKIVYHKDGWEPSRKGLENHKGVVEHGYEHVSLCICMKMWHIEKSYYLQNLENWNV